MATFPTPLRQGDEQPDYLPARMLNEFTYCPRLFFYEWVEGVFRESADTLEGAVQHARVDAKASSLPAPDEIQETIHARSVTLASERLRIIAKMDLVEGEDGVVTPVDYKHGRPREGKDGLELWPADRMQLAAQGVILRENGYRCDEGIVYYRKTGQRVRVQFDDALILELENTVAAARSTAEAGVIPPPLVDSPKCAGCSLAGICLPDETAVLETGVEAEPVQLGLFDGNAPRRPAVREVRPMVTPRYEQRTLYLNTQGVRVGKSGAVLQVRDKDSLLQEVRIGEICQVNLMGNIQISTQAIQTLCEAGVPICYFSMGGWFYGITTGLNTKNVFLRRWQFKLSEDEGFACGLARRLVCGKIRNQRTLMQRNHIEPNAQTLAELKRMAERAEGARSLDELLGIEGNAARLYFGDFQGLIKTDDGAESSEFRFEFEGRNRRPARDPVNALLSLGYSLLAKDLTVACYAVGFDPFIGFYHQPRFGRPALALDLMEPFRPLVVDSAVLTAVNTGMVRPKDFVRAGPSVALTGEGRKAFFRAYELKMDTLITHPLFEYRVSYRRLLEIQARLLARYLEGEIPDYPVFVTR
ncbi:MAG TPA: CRISPR-associated endonuclease Cas1 [Bryobacteraceae bacterium]|nr:CRISPR-associated endonuclease Cas1 [Bryobacteraceae bacterium]